MRYSILALLRCMWQTGQVESKAAKIYVQTFTRKASQFFFVFPCIRTKKIAAEHFVLWQGRKMKLAPNEMGEEFKKLACISENSILGDRCAHILPRRASYSNSVIFLPPPHTAVKRNFSNPSSQFRTKNP